MKAVLILAVVTTLAAPAAAQVTSLTSANPAPKGGKQDLNRIVCEVDETTGTRLGARKVCKTVGEWADMREQHRHTLEETQRMATSTGIPAN